VIVKHVWLDNTRSADRLEGITEEGRKRLCKHSVLLWGARIEWLIGSLPCPIGSLPCSIGSLRIHFCAIGSLRVLFCAIGSLRVQPNRQFVCTVRLLRHRHTVLFLARRFAYTVSDTTRASDCELELTAFRQFAVNAVGIRARAGCAVI
jgi:hypothetical protein